MTNSTTYTLSYKLKNPVINLVNLNCNQRDWFMQDLNITEQTVLRMINEADLGTDQTGLFRKHDDIIAELGTKDTTELIIEKLLKLGLIRYANDKFERVHGHKLTYDAYQITELGKSHLQPERTSTVFSEIHNSNIAHNSSHVTQSIHIWDLDPDIQKKIIEFDEAAERKDPALMKQAFGYIADKAVDVAIAMGTGLLLR